MLLYGDGQIIRAIGNSFLKLRKIFTIVSLILFAIRIFLLANNKEVMGEFVNNKWQNGIAIFGFVLISSMVYLMISKLFLFIDNG